jgi:ATP-binding cassette, subfamily B, bacterial
VKELSLQSHLRRSLRYLAPYAGRIALVLLLTLSASSLPALEPLVQGTVFDRLAAVGAGRASAPSVLLPALLLGVLALVRHALDGLGAVHTGRVRLRVHRDLLADAAGRLHTLPLSYHQRRGVGETMTLLERGISSFVEGLSAAAFQMIPALAYVVLSLAIMIHLSVPLTLLAVAFVFPPIVFGKAATTRLIERDRAVLERWCAIHNRFHQVLSGIKTVKAFGREADEHALMIASVETAERDAHHSVALQTRLSVGRNLSANLGRVAVLCGGVLLALDGHISVGVLIAFIGYTGGLYGPAQTLLGLYETVRRAELGLKTIYGVLDAEDRVPNAPDAIAPSCLAGGIELDRVTFRYDPASSAPPALDEVSLSIQPGEFVAVVGPSGAGKSTLADLIARFHDPTDGAVRIDGHDLRSMDQSALRRHVGIVTQEAFLFEDTIEANIRYGSPDADPEAVHAAARAAHADGIIARLPKGYETVVGRGGVHLSTGERQRVAIARALLKNPPIVILDEPTSSLDVEAEAAVQQAIEQLAGDRTTLVIAHRLDATTRADRVVVIDGGRIVEEGAPEKLLLRDGPYRRMMRLARADERHPCAACSSP